jgi:hypothetical protein
VSPGSARAMKSEKRDAGLESEHRSLKYIKIKDGTCINEVVNKYEKQCFIDCNQDNPDNYWLY